MRVALARAGHIALGVDFRGNTMQSLDMAYLQQQMIGHIQQAVASFERVPGAIDALVANGAGSIRIPKDVAQIIPNREAGAELATAWSDRCYDLGGFQAVDVLTCLDHLRGRFGALPRTYLCAQSAGMQVALGCLRLAPTTFDGLLELGGFYLTGEANLRESLTDPCFSGNCTVKVTITLRDRPVTMEVRCNVRQPVPCPGGRTIAPRTVADEIGLRLVQEGDWMTRLPPGFRCDTIAGADDQLLSSTIRRTLAQWFQQRRFAGSLRLLDAKQVDGQVCISTGHNCFGTIEAITTGLLMPWLAKQKAGVRAARGELGTDQERSVRTATGVWRMRFTGRPELQFVSGHP
jgi:hypothetical protein